MAVAKTVMAWLRQLPTNAIPETLDIVMQATGVNPETLLWGLLRSVPPEIKEAQLFEVDTAVMDAETPKLMTYVAALLYLLKFAAQDDEVVEEVMWTICIPILRIENSKAGPLQGEVIEMLVVTVKDLGLWRIMALTLGRICQQIFISETGMHVMAGSSMKESRFVSNSCQLVAALLKSATEGTQRNIASTSLEIEAEYFCTEVFCKFTEPALALLSQPLQTSLRHLAISTLLLPILRTLTSLGVSLANPIRSAMPEISRFTAARKIWESCKILFKKRPLECHDAYEALAVFAEYLFPPVQLENELLFQQNLNKIGVDYVDIREDPFFWNELKAGLAHVDPLIRERSLYVLKQAHPTCLGRSDDPNTSKLPEVCNTGDIRLERWRAFVFLYEIIDRCERAHLYEGTLMQKINFLLPFSKPYGGEKRPWANPGVRITTEGFDVDFKWVSILFQRGFHHEIVQVRQMVFRSFLELGWERAPKVKAFVPEEFVLGPFLSALDDPVHHQEIDQGRSDTSTLAAKFIRSYSASLSERNRELFTQRFAKAFAAKTPCSAGLMCFAVCIEAATVGLILMESGFSNSSKAGSFISSTVASEDDQFLDLENNPSKSNEIGGDVLDSLQLVLEKSKGHCDQDYRAKVSEHILAAAAATNQVPSVLVSKLAKFISSFPREILQHGGRLRDSLLKWLHPSRNEHSSISPGLESEKWLRRGLTIMLEEYLRSGKPNTESPLCNEDFGDWEATAQRWTRLVAIGVVSNETQQKLVLLVERYLTEIYQRAYMVPRVAEKTLILFRCLLKECETCACPEYPPRFSPSSSTESDERDYFRGSRLAQYAADSLLITLDVLVQNAKNSSGIFWEYRESSVFGVPLPTESRSQEMKLNEDQSAVASNVKQGVLAVTTLAETCMWYCRLRSAAEIPESVINFFWDFAWNAVIQPAAKTVTGAQVQLGSYEALVTVCGAWAATVSPRVVSKPMAQVLEKEPFVALSSATVVDNLVTALGRNVEDLISTGLLSKNKCDALVSFKWSCLEYLLSIPKAAVARLKGANDSVNQSESSISKSVLQDTLQEAIGSLESAGEEWIVPLLHSIRWLMQWDVLLPADSSEEAQDKSVQIMWLLVQSGWATMAKYCNQPRAAVWRAFLSAILHPTIFGNKEMHEAGIHEDDGPLKWLLCRLITKGDSTPRALSLTATHMTGLWLQFPATLTSYIDELETLILHGEEVVDNVIGDASTHMYEDIQDTMLWRGSGLERSEIYVDSEIYARITIATMLHIVAQVVETAANSQDSTALEAAKPGAECGRKLLLDLLTLVVEDSKLSKDPCPSGGSVSVRNCIRYLNGSKLHCSADSQRRSQKLRAWQILCILSQFASGREIGQVISLLEIAIESNNISSARHYIETFAIRLFLQFPDLVEKNLVPALNDRSMKAQALSSYISIAVNVVLFTSSAALQLDHLRQVLPAIFPFMMANDRRTNAFTQVLVYQLLHRWITGSEQVPPGQAVDCANTDDSCLDRTCLQSLAIYMEANADCMRMKPSMELYLDTFDPVFATTPQGVYCNQGWDYTAEENDVPIDQVSVAVVRQIFRFLNSARKVSTEECFRVKLITPDDLPRVQNLSNSIGKEMSSGSISKLDDSEHLQSLLSSEALSRSEISPETISSGPVDSTPCGSDAVSRLQKLHPQARSPFRKPGNSSDRSFEDRTDSSLQTLRLKKQGDELQGCKPQPELIVVATAPEEYSELAGFARTCEVFEKARLVITKTSRRPAYQSRPALKYPLPPYEVLDTTLKKYLNHKKNEGFTLLGLGNGVGSVLASNYSFCDRSVLVLGGEHGVVSADVVSMLDAVIDVTNPGGQQPLNGFVGASMGVHTTTTSLSFYLLDRLLNLRALEEINKVMVVSKCTQISVTTFSINRCTWLTVVLGGKLAGMGGALHTMAKGREAVALISTNRIARNQEFGPLNPSHEKGKSKRHHPPECLHGNTFLIKTTASQKKFGSDENGKPKLWSRGR